MLLGAPFPILSGLPIGLMGLSSFGASFAISGREAYIFKSFWLGCGCSAADSR